MKSWQQVMNLLALRKPASENDRTLILAYCQSQGLKGVYFRDGRKMPNANSELITNEEFRKWFRMEQFHIGEVVYCDDSRRICLVTYYDVGKVYSNFHIDASLTPSSETIEIRKEAGIHIATEEQKRTLQRVLAKVDLSWNPLSKMIVNRRAPKENRYVSLWVIEDMVGVGILKEIDPDGNIVLHCYYDMKEPQRFGLDVVMGSKFDYSIRAASNLEKTLIVEQLAGIDLCWHSKLKRLEPLDLRKKPGEKYYYLTGSWTIESAVESESKAHYRRYKKCNYFHTLEEAEEYMSQMILLRHQQLLERLKLK